jgi:arylsulfatase A-like enzyme
MRTTPISGLLFILVASALQFACAPPAGGPEAGRDKFMVRARLASSGGQGDSAEWKHAVFHPKGLRLRSALQAPGARLEWPVKIPDEGGVLEFKVRTVCDEQSRADTVPVRVVVEDGSRLQPIFQGSLDEHVPLDECAEVLSDRISLDPFKGREVTIRFESIGTGIHPGEGLSVAWGDPCLLVRESTRLPDIILVCADTLRRDRVGSYSGHPAAMHSIRCLAEDGVIFDNAFAQSPWTLSSVASVLTGLTPSFHGAGKRIGEAGADGTGPTDASQEGNFLKWKRSRLARLDSKARTLPELLDGRYSCLMINSNSFLSTHSDVINRFGAYIDRTYKGGKINKRLEEWLEEEGTDRLMFLYLHYLGPHQWPKVIEERRGADEDVIPEEGVTAYDELVRETDDYIAGLIELLKDHGLYDSSLVIFYSDHGEVLWDDRRKSKGHGHNLCNILLNVPLIMKFPHSARGGSRIPDEAPLTDIFNTIAHAGGFPIDEGRFMQNRSWYGAAGETSADRVRFIVSEYMLTGREQLALQRQGMKMVYDFEQDRHRLVEASTDEPLAGKRFQKAFELFKNRTDRYLEAAASGGGAVDEIDPDDEWLEELRKLGYLR